VSTALAAREPIDAEYLPRWVVLTSEQIDALVERALAGEAPMGTLYDRAAWPGGVPEMWRDWPLEVREAWDDAAHRYFHRRRELSETADGTPRVRELVRPTLAEAWEIVEASSRHPDPASRLSWMDLSLRMAALDPSLRAAILVSKRATQYQLCDRLGFRFGGPGSVREIVQAPCATCESVLPIWELENRMCGGCR
jgi:hypothetical protein